MQNLKIILKPRQRVLGRIDKVYELRYMYISQAVVDRTLYLKK